MNDDDDPMRLLSDILFEKGWGQALPTSAVDLFDALLSDGSHVRDAIDAQLRRSSTYVDGLESFAWEERRQDMAEFERMLASKSLPIGHTLGSVLDLLIACDVVVIDAGGEHSINRFARLPGEVLAWVVHQTDL